MKNKNNSYAFTEKLLNVLEKNRFSLSTGIIYIAVITAIRSYMEGVLVESKIQAIPIFPHHILNSYVMILMGALGIYLVTGEKLRKIWNLILFGWWMMLIPPIVDFFTAEEFGEPLLARYEYLSVEEILPALYYGANPLNWILREGPRGSQGQYMMFLALGLGTAGYVALKKDLPRKFIMMLKGKSSPIETIKGFAYSVLGYYAIMLAIGFIGILAVTFTFEGDQMFLFNLIPIGIQTRYYRFFTLYGYSELQVFSTGGLAITLIQRQLHMLMGALHAIQVLVLGALSLFIGYKRHFKIMLGHVRISKTIPFALVSFLGITSLNIVDPNHARGIALQLDHPFHFPYILFCVLAVFFLAQFSLLIDDIYRHKRGEKGDDPLTKGLIPIYHYKQLAISYLLICIFFSFLLGRYTLIIALVWVGVSILGSHLDWMKSIFGHFKVGTMGVLAFLFGIYTPESWPYVFVRRGIDESLIYDYRTITRITALSRDIIPIIPWVFITFTFVYLFYISDSKDLRKKIGISDMKHRIHLESFLIFIVLSFTLYYFHTGLIAFIFLTVAIMIPVWYNLLDSKNVVVLGYVLCLILFSIGFIV